MSKILIVEDDEMIRTELCRYLTENDFDVSAPFPVSGNVVEENPDLILLDICLGDEDGIALCRELRRTSDVPVIFVTGQDATESELEGFRAGADDYIRKPYQLPVLLARIQSLLNRRGGKGQSLTIDGVTLDLVFGQLICGDTVYELSKKEQQILYYLFTKYPVVVSRDEMIGYLWENKMFVDENILNVNLSRIRRRFKGTPLEHFIKTVPEKGWQIGGVSCT